MLDDVHRRQLLGVIRLEIRRQVLGKRLLGLVLLAFGPVTPVFIWALTPIPRRGFGGPIEIMSQFATMHQLYVYVSIVLGTLLVFMSLFRSEIMERSLHYVYLTPVPRSVLVVGKYLAGVLVAGAVFAAATAALFLLLVLPFGWDEASRFLFAGPGLKHLFAYLTIGVLGVVGYGAVFLLAGLVFRNPIPPAVIVWGWETIYFVLPPAAKQVSVIHYLRSLYPIPPKDWAGGIFSVLGDPASPFLAVPGLLVFAAIVVAISAWRATRMEVTYGDD